MQQSLFLPPRQQDSWHSDAIFDYIFMELMELHLPLQLLGRRLETASQTFSAAESSLGLLSRLTTIAPSLKQDLYLDLSMELEV